MTRSSKPAVLLTLLCALACWAAETDGRRYLGSPVPIPEDLPPAADVPYPKTGDRTSDGFLVKCYWFGNYYSVEKADGQGVIDLFGQLLSPLNYQQTTNASITISEEADHRGDLRGIIRDGTWSGNVQNLNYWRRTGERMPAGTGGSGSGAIPRSGDGAPIISVEHGQNTAGLHLSWSESDALAFDVDYHDLELKFNRQNIHDSIKVNPEAKKKRWKAKIMGMTVIEEPVQPGRDTVIRQVWGSERNNWYARWIMTRVCSFGKLKLITPREDPRAAPRDSGDGQNEFTFDSASPGTLVVNFKASVTPASATKALSGRVSFTMDPIGASAVVWDPPNGKAKEEGGFLVATATFKGLPAKNDDFGQKTVQLLLDGDVCEKAVVEIFFPKYAGKPGDKITVAATNHPGGVAGTPNWFYYWQEGGVCGIDANCSYDRDDDEDYGYCSPATTGSKIFLTKISHEKNDGPKRYTSAIGYGSVTVVGKGKGIKCVAETIEHERHHVWTYDQFHAGIAAAPDTDSDEDGVPKANEPALDGLRTDPDDPNTYRVPDYSEIGDDEVRCRKKELRVTVPYYPKRDWANPGCQSKNKWGPE